MKDSPIVVINYTAKLTYSKIIGEQEIKNLLEDIKLQNPNYRLVATTGKDNPETEEYYYLDIEDRQPKELRIFARNVGMVLEVIYECEGYRNG